MTNERKLELVQKWGFRLGVAIACIIPCLAIFLGILLAIYFPIL